MAVIANPLEATMTKIKVMTDLAASPTKLYINRDVKVWMETGEHNGWVTFMEQESSNNNSALLDRIRCVYEMEEKLAEKRMRAYSKQENKKLIRIGGFGVMLIGLGMVLGVVGK